jgi:hypothetical protein
VMGGPLPTGTVVHHLNENRSDNRPGNLVICQDDTYHKLLHRRMRAYVATGDVHSVKCRRCKQYGREEEADMRTYRDGSSCHRACQADYERMRCAPNGQTSTTCM